MITKFSLGNVLALGFRTWARNFLPFTLLTLMVYAPLLLWGISVAQEGEDSSAYFHEINRFVIYSPGLVVVLSILVSSAVTYGAVMDLRGQRATLGACFAVGLRRFFPAVGVLFLMMLCGIGLYLIVALPLGLVFAPFGVLVLIPVIAVLYAMLWLYTSMYVAMQACVIERPGIAASLGRSRDLTRGHKIAIGVLAILLVVCNFGLNKLVEQLTLPGEHYTAYIYAALARDVLIGSVGAVMASVAYYLLRAEKEGTSADELAAVFD